ncbi:Asp-tRNA(Asn)/Glu-tRNA(Gln) amidotransferase subunit GatC [Patescibacteria group bacterium]|nr:Asp-tRNA(Asn)/Glu-tRNA(Gln) amidotransferase subunit GatC [Patescibacteria group bacterium]
MTVTDKELDHLAKLAALHLGKEEKATLGKQVNTIIDFVGKLQEVDVEGIEPLARPIEGMKVPLFTEGEVYPDPDALLVNTKHQLKDRGIVMKSAITNEN